MLVIWKRKIIRNEKSDATNKEVFGYKLIQYESGKSMAVKNGLFYTFSPEHETIIDDCCKTKSMAMLKCDEIDGSVFKNFCNFIIDYPNEVELRVIKEDHYEPDPTKTAPPEKADLNKLLKEQNGRH